ncbi:MAG: hypothetical protein QGH81_04815 [Candidatus Poseidoniia archaeon]|nr:hypothetical protein [Candidatus Poseidoniia archaeon]
MAQPQQYGSIREFLDNLPHQPCIWQPENQNICVTCLRINEPVARICSVWSQALDNAPLEELDFEEEMRSLPAVEKVAETPATPGLVGIDVIDGEDAEYSVVKAVATEPAVSESSIAVVDIDLVVAEEPTEAREESADEEVRTESDDEVAGLDTGSEMPDDGEAADTTEVEVVEPEAIVEEADTDAEVVDAEAIEPEVVAEEADTDAEVVDAEAIEPEVVAEEADTDSDVVDAEAPPIAVVEASLVDAGTTTTDATPPNTRRPLWKFWGGGEPVEAASELDNEGVGVPEPGDDGAGELEPLLGSEPDVLSDALSDAPFARGEVVKHAVYGSGTVRESVLTGQQWSVRVDFSSGERSILSHFLEGSVEEAYNSDEYSAPEVSARTNEVLVAAEAVEAEPEAVEAEPEAVEVEPEAVEVEPEAVEVEPEAVEVEPEAVEVEPEAVEAEPEAVEVEPEAVEVEPEAVEVEPEAVEAEPEAVEAELDSDGKAEADSVSEIALENPFPLGCRISHAFFGSGTVRESHPKDEHWRLEVEFEDGSQRPLLSSFVKLLDEGDEVMPDAPQVVEADPVPESEAIETEPVISEPEATEELEEEPTIDVEPAVIESERAEEPEVESMISEPGPIEVVVEVAEPIESEPVEVQPAVVEAEPAAPLDLAEPAVFEAEMIDEPPVASPVIEPQPVLEAEVEVPEISAPVVVSLSESIKESDPEVSAVGSLEAKQARGRGRRKGQKARCSKCGGEGHYAKTCSVGSSIEPIQKVPTRRGRRKGQKARCSKCGGEGHYAKTCTN